MIVVVDYGMGNLRSVSKAIEHLGANVRVSASPEEILNAEKVVLPGVGAFGDAARELQSRGLVEPLRQVIRGETRFLGICLGLQLLFLESDENPGVEGLGVFPGHVDAFYSRDVKVPHMGWNELKIRMDHPLLKGIQDRSYFYFVHSFYASCVDEGMIAGTCEYGSEEFTAAVATDTVFATQFHPEKSQQAGLRILKNFIEW